MWLKLLTTAAFGFGILLLALWPWIYRQRPGLHSTFVPHRNLEEFQLMFAGYICASAFTFMMAACLSALLIRQTREEFGRESTENLRGLVEGSLEDLRAGQRKGPKS
jgi:hypothetical protein